MIRLHVSDDLNLETEVAPSPDQARYLTSVMRQGVGDQILVFNGRDGEWRTELSEITRKAVRLRLLAQTRPQQAGPDLDLLIALVKRARLETIVEKATELGVARIRLITTARTNADHTNVSRLQAIAIEAAEQTGRLEVPTVTAPERLARLIDGWTAERTLVFCDEAGDDPDAPWGGERGRAGAALTVLSASPAAPGAVLIGPEGGFSPEERSRLRALPFVRAVSLGPRILRADTAAIAALTLWQAVRGDWA